MRGRGATGRVLLLLFAAAAAAQAADPDDQALAAARVAAVQKLRSIEKEADDAATELDALARRRETLGAELDARAKAIAPLLPLAERMRLDPTEALLASDLPPDAALHGLLVLRGLTRRLERDAETLRAEQAELDRLAREIAAVAPRLRAAQETQAAQAAALDEAIAAARERRAQEEAAEDRAARAARAAAEQAARQAAEAASLNAAVDRLRDAPPRGIPRPPPFRRETAMADRIEPAGAGHGMARLGETRLGETRLGATRLAVPVAGRIVQGWGSPTDAGPAEGVTFRAPPRAKVSAPCAGRVAFASPFRSFGLLVILDCGRGVNVVMSGFASLDVSVGRTLQAGEPVGTMPGWDPEAPGSRPGLYVELRRDGRRVDPGPLLNAP